MKGPLIPAFKIAFKMVFQDNANIEMNLAGSNVIAAATAG